MTRNLLTFAGIIIILSACSSTARNSSNTTATIVADTATLRMPDSSATMLLTNLSRTEEGGFVLAPGLYEAEFKTYCLQPGTPGPVPGNAYLQVPMSGYRKEIVETILLNSRSNPGIEQRNIQLLLWSVVSKSDFNKLSPAVKADARELLTPKQIFELKGGVMGVVQTVSNTLPGTIAKNTSEIKRLFETGVSSYEAFEQLAVLRDAAQEKQSVTSNNQWYKQKEGYYVRHLPVSYQKIKIQVYVPDGILDADGKSKGEYLVFDPVGLQTIPVSANAQRLGIGVPVVDIIRNVIKISKPATPVKKLPEPKKDPKVVSKT